jgi:soluble lytic murein transglycosylase
MSSMRSVGIIIPLLLSTMAVASMQQTSSTPASTAASVQATSQAAVTEINYALADWRRLRASQGYAFADYARFLNANPGWPSESTMRRSAERQMRPGENANVVLAFFRTDEPRTGTGWARLAEANLSIGRSAEALAAARGAWMSSDLSQYDEQLIFSRFGTQLSAADHDKRVDALLLDKKASDAYRMLPWSSPARRAALQARIAMQARQPEAEQRYQAVIGQVTSDAGLMMDRARYLRDSGYVQASRDLFARSHNFGAKPPIPSGSST